MEGFVVGVYLTVLKADGAKNDNIELIRYVSVVANASYRVGDSTDKRIATYYARIGVRVRVGSQLNWV